MRRPGHERKGHRDPNGGCPPPTTPDEVAPCNPTVRPPGRDGGTTVTVTVGTQQRCEGPRVRELRGTYVLYCTVRSRT